MAIRIILDPGHMAGYNKASHGYSEGTRMWDYYHLLSAELKKYGFVVGCTKSTINGYPKDSRGNDMVTARGNRAKGYDIMLSLHTNACGSSRVKRPLCIYPVSGKHKALAVNIAKALHEMLGNSDKPTYQAYPRYNSRGNADYYGVIRGAAAVNVPCIIIEHMFHSNPDCAAWLMNDNNLKRMAEVVAGTVADYFGYKKSSGSTEQPKEVGTGYLVKITAGVLNVRSGPGTHYRINTTVKKGGVYTIVQQSGDWGKLKSGAGWIHLGYAKRV